MNSKSDETNANEVDTQEKIHNKEIFLKFSTEDLYYRLLSGILLGLIFFVLACVFGLWASTSAHNANNPQFWNMMFTMAFSLSVGGFLSGFISEWPRLRQKDIKKGPGFLQNLIVGLSFSLILGLIGIVVLPKWPDIDFLMIFGFIGFGAFAGFIVYAKYSNDTASQSISKDNNNLSG